MMRDCSVSSYNRYLTQISTKQEKLGAPQQDRHSRGERSGILPNRTQFLFIRIMTECVEVVEVTDETFEQELPHIQKVIFDSAFAAFDMEFSGLEVKPCHKSVQVDTVLVPFF